MEIIWIILGIISVVLLVVYWWSKNAIWGGFIIGIIIGSIITLISGFDWYIIGKGAISGTIVGFAAELLGKISDKIRNRK